MTMTNNGEAGRGDDPILDQEMHWQQVAQRQYEPDRDGELTTAIVYAIADAQDIDPTELKTPPLYEIVDIAAIDDAFFGTNSENGSQQGMGTVKFQYIENLIKIKSDGWISVYESAETGLS